ncbi:MAG: transporter substrate-binding domain-containing protein [Candidatus Aminicenantes bacterium]|nr:transporter substrate-binding domain-containing protein [Candidatus Aminicenantes bacterium]
MIKKSILNILFICVLILISTQPVSSVELDKIISSGKIIVGTSADYPPYEFFLMNDKDNELVGLDIDIANVIGKELGVKVVIKNLIFHKLFSVLESGEVDILIAGLNPTYARTRIADFSDIYYKAIQNLVIRKKDSEKIAFLKDLRGKTVGTQKGSIQSEMAPTQITGAKFMFFDSISDLISNLKNGTLDAVILEKPVAKSYVTRNDDLISIECLSSGADYSPLGSAIAVKKGNKNLLKKINEIIRKLKSENKIDEFVENAKILLNKR